MAPEAPRQVVARGDWRSPSAETRGGRRGPAAVGPATAGYWTGGRGVFLTVTYRTGLVARNGSLPSAGHCPGVSAGRNDRCNVEQRSSTLIFVEFLAQRPAGQRSDEMT